LEHSTTREWNGLKHRTLLQVAEIDATEQGLINTLPSRYARIVGARFFFIDDILSRRQRFQNGLSFARRR
jgi:hypothetical protein